MGVGFQSCLGGGPRRNLQHHAHWTVCALAHTHVHVHPARQIALCVCVCVCVCVRPCRHSRERIGEHDILRELSARVQMARACEQRARAHVQSERAVEQGACTVHTGRVHNAQGWQARTRVACQQVPLRGCVRRVHSAQGWQAHTRVACQHEYERAFFTCAL